MSLARYKEAARRIKRLSICATPTPPRAHVSVTPHIRRKATCPSGRCPACIGYIQCRAQTGKATRGTSSCTGAYRSWYPGASFATRTLPCNSTHALGSNRSATAADIFVLASGCRMFGAWPVDARNLFLRPSISGEPLPGELVCVCAHPRRSCIFNVSRYNFSELPKHIWELPHQGLLATHV